MALFCTTHHTLTIESWNENGVHVLDQDTQHVRLLLRDEKEVDEFIAALRAAQPSVQRTCFNCGGPVNVSTGYILCERGCGGPVIASR